MWRGALILAACVAGEAAAATVLLAVVGLPVLLLLAGALILHASALGILLVV